MINFAIVGCGHIAKKHAEALALIPDARLHAVCDPVFERMEEYQLKYNVNTYATLEQVLEDKQIDVVSICTPSGYHAEIAIKLARAKKHIVVEKPIALSVQDADLMLEAAKENGVKLTVVHPNRFRPAVQIMKKAMEQGWFGKLSHVNSTVRWNRNQAYYDQSAWRGTKALDGGVLMNQAIHNLDLLYWLVGEIEEVKAYHTTRFRQIEVEDLSIGILKFVNGALGVSEAATTIYPKSYEESISIFGETGSMVISGQTGNWIKHMVFENLSTAEVEHYIESVNHNPFGDQTGHYYILKNMTDVVINGENPIIDGFHGREVLRLVLAFTDASEKNQSIQM